MKHLEGKTVYFEPTGNNARTNQQVRKGKIIKVSRVNVTVEFEGWGRQVKYRISINAKNHLNSGYNSGWHVFESLEDIELEKEKCTLCEIMSKKFRYSMDLMKFDLETLKKVAELLGVHL